MITLRLDIDPANYAGFDDTTPTVLELTARQAAYCLAVFQWLNNRDAWEEMSDSEWEALSDTIAVAIEELTIP